MNNTIVYSFGLLSMAFGFLLVVRPEFVNKKPKPEDVFRAVERRAWWGLLIGLGLFCFSLPSINSYLVGFFVLATAATLGILIARLIGIFLEGSHRRQWFWVWVELLVVLVLASAGVWFSV